MGLVTGACLAHVGYRVVGADVFSVAHGIGFDDRMGSRFLNAASVGGSCFPKDISALRSITRGYDHCPVH